MPDIQHFAYSAVDANGRRVRGGLTASDDTHAFEQLRRDGLSPLTLKRASNAKKRSTYSRGPSDREAAELLSNLAELLRAGADIRTALSILSSQSERPGVKAACDTLAVAIGGGEALDQAFGRSFARNQALVTSLVGAGEASGDLPGSLERAAAMLEYRLKLRDQLVSVMAYPSFVLVSAIAALLLILLVIIPSIAPLVQETTKDPPASLGLLLAASEFLTQKFAIIGIGVTILAGLLAVAWRVGVLSGPLGRLFMDGPAKRTVRGIVFGAFAISLGGMLTAGAPISEALRLAVRATPSDLGRRRLEAVGPAVRQGERLSTALAQLPSFPNSIIRLAAVGEAAGSVGAMLVRAGQLEESRAIKRIELAGKIAGPALIVILGILLGTVMASLLSGLSQIGEFALD